MHGVEKSEFIALRDNACEYKKNEYVTHLVNNFYLLSHL